MNDCVFCDIVKNSPDKHIWSNELAVAFQTIKPLAPKHVLVVPREHIKNIDALNDPVVAGQLIMAVREVIKMLGIVEANKLVVQGLEIDHLHFHVMSDQRFKG